MSSVSKAWVVIFFFLCKMRIHNTHDQPTSTEGRVLAGEGLGLRVRGVEVPVEARHVAAAEAELARGVAAARVQAPAAPRWVQTSTLNNHQMYFHIHTYIWGPSV